MAHLGTRPLRPGDVVQHDPTFVRRALHQSLVEPLATLGVEPSEAASHGGLKVLLVQHDEIHELRHTGVARTSGSRVTRNDEVGENAHSYILVGGEKLWYELSTALRSLHSGRPGRAASLLGVFERPVERRRERRDGEELYDLASVHCAHHKFPLFRSSAMYSLVRMASAMSVHVGFLSACDTNGPPSATNRFFTSCV